MKKTPQENQKKKINLNWLTITRIFWKEQLIFWLLATLSAVTNYIMDVNIARLIEKLLTGKGKWGKDITFKFWDKDLLTFQDKSGFFWFLAIYITIYCLIVIAHVYYRFWLENKISRFLRGKISQKLFRLKKYDKKQILINFDSDEKTFSSMLVHFPNQLYYLLLTIFLTFTGLWIAKGKDANNDILIYGAIGLVIVAVVCLLFNYFVYKRDLTLQKRAEKMKKTENSLVNNRDLIIKKSLTPTYQIDYQKTVNETYSSTDKRDWSFTLTMVIPSYSLVPYMEYIVLPLICFTSDKFNYLSLSLLSKLYNQEKKMLDRLKEYPYYFSAKKRLNWLLNQPERDDYQNNVIVSEPIETITFQNVDFAYETDKLVLNNYNVEFRRGQINHLQGSNGFGKSTIINLITGLYQPKNGKILINNKYQLNQINLENFRHRKIAYAEHSSNLVENGLSTGQKQLKDLTEIFAMQDKEIFVFDEANNALDGENEKWFHQELEKLVKNGKLVIFIGH